MKVEIHNGMFTGWIVYDDPYEFRVRLRRKNRPRNSVRETVILVNNPPFSRIRCRCHPRNAATNASNPTLLLK